MKRLSFNFYSIFKLYIQSVCIKILLKENYFLTLVSKLILLKYKSKISVRPSLNNVYNNKKSIKILFVTHSLGPGGAERQIVSLINELSEIGNRLKLIPKLDITLALYRCSSLYDSHFKQDLKTNIKVINLEKSLDKSKIDLNNLWVNSFLNIYSSENQCLDTLIADLNPDIVHGWLDYPGLCASLLGLKHNISKILISTRSVAPKSYLRQRFLYYLVFKIVTLNGVNLLNNSNFGALSYENWLDLHKGSVKVIKNGYTLENILKYYQPLKKPSNNSTVILVGCILRTTYEKNIFLLRTVIKKLLKQSINVKIKIFLATPNDSIFKKYSALLCIDKNVTVQRPVHNIYKEIAKFDILLSTSIVEGLPNVLIESQLLGVPVVATDAGGSNETFMDGQSGILVKSKNAEYISREIINLSNDKDKLDSFAQHARMFARQNFMMSDIARQYLEIYNLRIKDQ
jgi:glycosyltransferase involved in cell wall biosynthesis